MRNKRNKKQNLLRPGSDLTVQYGVALASKLAKNALLANTTGLDVILGKWKEATHVF